MTQTHQRALGVAWMSLQTHMTSPMMNLPLQCKTYTLFNVHSTRHARGPWAFPVAGQLGLARGTARIVALTWLDLLAKMVGNLVTAQSKAISV